MIIFFSTDFTIIDEWKLRNIEKNVMTFDDIDILQKWLERLTHYTLVVDYDSVAREINGLISADKLPKYMIVLEKVPAITTGRMLISHGVKAYGNSRMLNLHYMQMIEAVKSNRVWTYPELTISLANNKRVDKLSKDSIELLENRLTTKEREVVDLILTGLTNDAIASKQSITPRTVKAHISSIFHKLHVSDRISLVLLLK